MKTITQNLNELTPLERRELERKAASAGMTVDEWVEYSLKAQIYRDADERLNQEQKSGS